MRVKLMGKLKTQELLTNRLSLPTMPAQLTLETVPVGARGGNP